MRIDFAPGNERLKITGGWDTFATYDTPAQVTAVIARLRDAIVDGATEFKIPTVGELNQPTGNEWRAVRTKTNSRNVNLTAYIAARSNA